MVGEETDEEPGTETLLPIKSPNSFAEAFDKDLSTFWLSPTPREENDRIVVRFNPQTDIAAFTVYAGDPTGAQVVPEVIQMTFSGLRRTSTTRRPSSTRPPRKTVTAR